MVYLHFVDYSGCGLSDGDFAQTTVERMTDELLFVIKELKREVDLKSLVVVAHSLSACVVAKLFNKKIFEKIILLAPALNQKELLRYWFVKSSSKEEIDWTNYKYFLDTRQFEEDCKRKNRMTKSNFIESKYFLENKEMDYSEMLIGAQNILHIHGSKDDDVPLESVGTRFSNRLIIEGANHDLEKPNVFENWLKIIINFIK